jgi:hypothetical protein
MSLSTERGLPINRLAGPCAACPAQVWLAAMRAPRQGGTLMRRSLQFQRRQAEEMGIDP